MMYFLSPSSEPSFNLALEAYLLNNIPTVNGILLLYINKPSVICGKNQCIWTEVNWKHLFSGGEVYRRVSGGGTVYHDEGNLNFSFIVPHNDKLVNDYSYFNTKLVKALTANGFPVEVNQRADILLNGKKISGNAQFTNRKNMISHGTILYNADLEKLSLALKKNDFSVNTRAVSSVRSQVTNLFDYGKSIDSIDSLKKIILKFYELNEEWKPNNFQIEEIEAIKKSQMMSNDWLWNRNPDFDVKKEDMEFEVKDKILSFRYLENDLKPLWELNGCFFTPIDIKNGLKKISSTHSQYDYLLKRLIS